MKREAVRGMLQIGFFFSLLSLCSLAYQPRDSGEFVVSACSLGIGILILLLAAIFIFLTG